jgi:uncharacterized membrane protein
MSRVWRNKEDLRVSLYVTLSKSSTTFSILDLNRVSKMIGVLVSIFALIAAVSVAYLLTIIDSIIHNQLYQFGLQFSYEWANPYWIVLRISLALLGLIAVASLINLTYFFWQKLRKSEVAEEVEKEVKEEAAPLGEGVPSLFQCTSCGRSITHPLRMLDFHSQRPKMINICPFCNATVVPVSYAYSEEKIKSAEEEEEKIEKRG